MTFFSYFQAVSRPRIKRVTLRDVLFFMEQERTLTKSNLMYKSLLKWGDNQRVVNGQCYVKSVTRKELPYLGQITMDCRTATKRQIVQPKVLLLNMAAFIHSDVSIAQGQMAIRYHGDKLAWRSGTYGGRMNWTVRWHIVQTADTSFGGWMNWNWSTARSSHIS